jgi:hypothetical protein
METTIVQERSPINAGVVGCGAAWRGEAGHGEARPGTAGHGWARHGTAWRGKAGQGMARQGKDNRPRDRHGAASTRLGGIKEDQHDDHCHPPQHL